MDCTSGASASNSTVRVLWWDFESACYVHSGWISQAQCLWIGSWILQLKSAMSQGQLLPDEVIFRLLSKRLEHGASCGELGFILDGFPRTVNQAVWLLENVWDFFGCHGILVSSGIWLRILWTLLTGANLFISKQLIDLYFDPLLVKGFLVEVLYVAF